MTTYDFEKLNSATKYPSIPTYHTLDRGVLSEPAVDFGDLGTVYWTEKVDGTNGRIIRMPDGDWFIGAREHLLTAKGDRIPNPAQSIASVLTPVAERLKGDQNLDGDAASRFIQVYFFEVYGHGIQAAAKQYTTQGHQDCRLFDIAYIPVDVLTWDRDKIASWRDAGGYLWAVEAVLRRCAEADQVELTPRMGFCMAQELPKTVEGMHEFLMRNMDESHATLDEEAPGRPEGLVLRTRNRRIIAKARFEDYERTARKRK